MLLCWAPHSSLGRWATLGMGRDWPFITPCTPSSHSLSPLPALEWSLPEAGDGAIDVTLCPPRCACLGAGKRSRLPRAPSASESRWKSEQMWFRKLQLRGTLAPQMASEEICTSVDARKNGVFKVKMKWKPAFPPPSPSEAAFAKWGLCFEMFEAHRRPSFCFFRFAVLFFASISRISLCLESIPRQLSAPLISCRVQGVSRGLLKGCLVC